MVREARFALNKIARAPGYTLAFVLTLGLGIGANTAIFSVINAVLLRPLPHLNGDRLVYLRHSAELVAIDNVLFSVPEIEDYRQQVPSLRGVAEHSAMTFTMLGQDEPRRVVAGVVTGNYFSVLGLRPVLGRLLNQEDDGEGADPVVVLTHEYWGRVFGEDPDVLGRTFTMNGRTITVVGVLEPAPPYPERTDVYVNMVSSPHHMGASMSHDRVHRMTEVFARLAPGATLQSARSEVAEVTGRLHEGYPQAYDPTAGYSVSVTGLRDQLTRRARPTLLILLGTAGFVLIIACANVANLTLTRVIRRERELAIRASLGADRWTLRRELLAESLTLSLMGAVFGLLVALVGLDALVAFTARYTVRASEVSMDGWVFLFALLVATGAALLFAWVPRIPGSAETGMRLHATGTRTTGGVGRKEVQRSLVVAQIAVSFVLLVGAGLLMRTLISLQTTDPGFETENLLTLDIPPMNGGRNPVETRDFYGTILERARALPGVRSVALGTTVPLRSTPSEFTSTLEMRIEGVDPGPGRPAVRADLRPVSPDYFQALGMTLIAGRLFAATDDTESPDVVIINETMAERYFPGRDPVGEKTAWSDARLRFFELEDGWRTIVGVVADTHDYGLGADVLPTVFQPFAQFPSASALFVRAGGSPSALVRPLVDIIRALDPDQPVENILTLEEIRAESLAPQRVNAALIGAFALLALTIAAVGVFGVLAFSVSQRTREFGVRTALGANEVQVLSEVLREGAMLAGIGLLLGGMAAVGLSSFLAGLLFGVQPQDPATFVAVAAVLAVVAVTAAWLPARRAARVDPVEALRAE